MPNTQCHRRPGTPPLWEVVSPGLLAVQPERKFPLGLGGATWLEKVKKERCFFQQLTPDFLPK